MVDKDKDTQSEASAESTVDDSHTGPRISVHSIMEAACDLGNQMEEAMMAIVPPEVTEHLINAKKELIEAGIRVGELTKERLDKKSRRAHEIHDQMKAEKGAAKD